MISIRKARAMGLIAALTGVWAAGNECSETITTTASVSSVVITPSPMTIVETEEALLEAVARDAAGHPLEGRSIEWSSNHPDIATVGPSGLVRGMAAGVASIQATVEVKMSVEARSEPV